MREQDQLYFLTGIHQMMSLPLPLWTCLGASQRLFEVHFLRSPHKTELDYLHKTETGSASLGFSCKAAQSGEKRNNFETKVKKQAKVLSQNNRSQAPGNPAC